MRTISQQPAGIILILVILIIAVVLSAAALFATLVIRDIAQSRLIDQSIQAHYIAESGAEHALYQIRKRQAVVADACSAISTSGTSFCNPDTGYCSGAELEGQVSCITQGTELPLVSAWGVSAEHELNFRFNLGLGETIQIDLFDPFQRSNPGGQLPSGIREIHVRWGDRDHQPDLYQTLLTVLTDQGTEEFDKGELPGGTCTPLPGQPCNFPVFDVAIPTDPTRSYLLRLRSLYFLDEAPGTIEVAVYDQSPVQGGVQLPIPSRLLVSSVGNFGDSEQHIIVQTPTRPPLSGLYDFVLFSEEEVVKTTP